MIKYFILMVCFLFTKAVQAQLFNEKLVTKQVTGSREIIVADIDGDGHDDILNINRLPDDNFVWIKNNNNASSFDTPIEIGNLENPQFFTTADIDGDGDVDVIGTRLFQPNDRLVWFENVNGQGTFSAANDIVTMTEGQAIVKAADLDGDLDIDLVVNSRDDGALAWYENLDGLGTFGPSQIIITNYVTFTGLDVGDIDGDGDIDIVAGTSTLNRMAWFENTDGLGAFSAPNPISTPGIAVTFVGISDIDGDNDLDIFGTGGNDISWWENLDGAGTFSLENNIPTSIEIPFKAISADFDNDVDNDLAVTGAIEGEVYWFENIDGEGAFGSEQLVSDNLPFTISLASADFDNDGDIDLVSAPQSDSDVVFWYENQTILNVPEQEKFNLSVHPNPVQDILFISSPNIKLDQIIITNAQGKVVFETKNEIEKVDVSTFSSGVYLVTLRSNNGVKIVKQFVKE